MTEKYAVNAKYKVYLDMLELFKRFQKVNTYGKAKIYLSICNMIFSKQYFKCCIFYFFIWSFWIELNLLFLDMCWHCGISRKYCYNHSSIKKIYEGMGICHYVKKYQCKISNFHNFVWITSQHLLFSSKSTIYYLQIS